jgi:DNA-binding CsgD family transcriptional regulator/tetratricopeptide (TPR) repeat protein
MIEVMGGRITSPELIGREAELETVARAFEQACAGQGRTLLIGGEAGIGKTRLLSAALDGARARGAVVLQGGCIGLAEGSLPFAPIVEAIRPLLTDHAATSATLTAADAPHPAEIQAALAGVATGFGLLARRHGADAAAELHPDWARSELYETFLRLLRRLAADSPVVLAVEDLHWAGDSTRELLAFLIRNARAERLLLLVTFRSDELHRRHPLLPWLGEANRSPGVERIELARLERAAVARQLAGIIGRAADASLLESIYSRSEGNPFFAEELVAAGAESGPLPPTLREVLAARLAHVSEATLDLLGVAALVGRRVDHDLLVRVSDVSEEHLDEAIGEALSAQLLVTDEASGDASLRSTAFQRYAFRHALLAEAAAETVLPSRRRRLHAAIAQTLSDSNGLRGAEEAGHLTEIAHHWFEARVLDKAFTSSLRAGDATFSSGAYAEALRQYERALELWDIVTEKAVGTAAALTDAPGREAAELEIDRLDLLRRAAHTAQLAGEYARAAQLVREAIELARARGDVILEGLLYERLGRSLWTSGNFAGADEAYRRAVELVPDEPPSADRARVLAGFAQILMLAGHHSQSLSVGKRALELARATGSRQLEGHALCTIGGDIAFMGDVETGSAMTRQAIDIAEEVQDLDDVGRGYANHASVLDSGGRREEAEAIALQGGRRMRELGMGATYGAFIEMNAADEMVALGRWDEAFKLASDVRPTARGNSQLYATTQLAHLLTHRGEFEAAAQALEEQSRLLGEGVEAQFNGPIATIRISLAIYTGDTPAGRRVVDRALPILAQTEDRVLQARLLATAVRLEARAGERARAARDKKALAEATQRANAHLAAVRQLAGTMPPSARLNEIEQSIAMAEAEASRLGPSSDASKWRRVFEMARVNHPVYDAAYAEFRLAEALLADKEARGEAAALLAEAHATASRLGALPLAGDIAALAARARVPLPESAAAAAPDESVTAAREGRGGAAPSVSDGLAAYGLSEREMEVLRLVAAGRTNRQIGEALFISESTAGVHVSHILTKLNVAGRVEAATIAARLGLT